jgi:hypothetical protein
MDAPVTRRELNQTLDTWAATIINTTIDTITSRFTAAMSAMETRLTTAMDTLEARMTAMIHAAEARLSDELRRGTKASEEELTTRIRVIDDKYKDLPDRVARVEAKVFPPKTTARPRKRS